MQKIWNTINNQIPKDWAIKTLPEFSRIEMGQSPSSNTYNFDGRGLPFFQGKAEFGEFYPKVNKYCSEPKKIAEEGAVLLSVRAPVGPTNLAKEKSCIGRGLAALHPLDGMDSKFLLFLLRSIEPELSSQGTGSTFKAITKGFVENMAFAIPDIREQEYIITKIEELFSELDSGIASLKTAQQQLKIYRQSLLKHAFEGKLTEQWRKDNADKLETPEQLLARIQTERETRYQQQLDEWKQAVKDWEAKGKEGKRPTKPKVFEKNGEADNKLTSGLEIPESWKLMPIGHVFSVFVGATPSRKNPIYWDGDVNWVSSGEVSFCSIYQTKEKISQEGYENTSTELHPKGTVLLAMIGEGKTRGQAAILRIPAAHNQNTAAIRVSEIGLPAEYIYYFLQYQYEQTRKAGSGNNQKARNKSRVSNIVFPLCSVAEQKEIVNQLEEKLSIIEQNEKEIEDALTKAELLRQSILKKAFSGQLL